MIINNSKFNFSLDNTSELQRLILENLDLPLLIFAGEEAWNGDFPYSQVDAHVPSIQNLVLYNDMWMDEDDYRGRLSDDLCDREEYADLSDEEYFKMIDKIVEETECAQAIVIYVG